MKKRSFRVLASFRLSYKGFSNLRLRQRPMIGTTRQNPKILAPHGYSFSSNALAWQRMKSKFRRALGRGVERDREVAAIVEQFNAGERGAEPYFERTPFVRLMQG